MIPGQAKIVSFPTRTIREVSDMERFVTSGRPSKEREITLPKYFDTLHHDKQARAYAKAGNKPIAAIHKSLRRQGEKQLSPLSKQNVKGFRETDRKFGTPT
jgi:hypothetical protein